MRIAALAPARIRGAFATALCCAALLAGAAAANTELEFAMRGDTLTVRADKAPLEEVLRRFAREGVRVRADPSIHLDITATFTGRDLDSALDGLFQGVNFSARWAVLPGPLGQIQRLVELDVYRPGHESSLRAIPAPPRSVATGVVARVTYVGDEVLIRLKPGVTEAQARSLFAAMGGHAIDSVPALGLYRLRLVQGSDVPAVLKRFADDPRVAALEANEIFRTPAPTVSPAPSAPNPLANFPEPPAAGAPPVAVLDSGLAVTSGLRAVVIAGYDVINATTNMTDHVGHGTQMALIASGLIAPNGTAADPQSAGVPVIAIKAFDDNGAASNFELMRSIGYAVDAGARVINLSWYAEGSSDFLRDAIRYAQTRNVVVVAAAGNEPIGRPVYPAALDGVLAVGAANADGSVWDQSNYGSFVDITSPGFASLPVGYKGEPGLYAGTSIASAYTASVLARYLKLHPDATSEQAVAALTKAVTAGGAQPLSGSGHGAGLLDDAAVRRLLK